GAPGGLRVDWMQRAVADLAGGGRADRGELHECKRGRGSADSEGEAGRADGRRCGASSSDDGGELGSAVQRRDGEAAALRTGTSGSRHRVFPEGAGDARISSVSRLHRVAAGRGQVPERCARWQHGFRAVGVCVGYRRKACDENHDGRGIGWGEDRRRGSGGAYGASGGDRVYAGEEGARDTITDFGDVYGDWKLSAGGRRVGV